MFRDLAWKRTLNRTTRGDQERLSLIYAAGMLLPAASWIKAGDESRSDSDLKGNGKYDKLTLFRVVVSCWVNPRAG